MEIINIVWTLPVIVRDTEAHDAARRLVPRLDDAYRDLGIDAFILSGYPHLGACERVARTVLDDYPHAPLRWPVRR